MPVTINGRSLGVAENGHFTEANTDPIPSGRLWPEAALTWNAMRAAYVASGGRASDFVPAGPASSARSRSAQDFFWRNQPPPAARPYSSNHGWGIAVDVKTRVAVAWLHAHASSYGWSHDEGARVGEWWHWRYVGAPRALILRLKADPLAVYTPAERRWIKEYDRLKRVKNRSTPQEARLLSLRRVMTEQRKRIFRIAEKDGWTWARKRRYESLRSRTTTKRRKT